LLVPRKSYTRYVMLSAVISWSVATGISFSHGAQPTFFADSERSWSDGTSVILAEVEEVKQIDGRRYGAVLLPRGTLSGTFDCGQHAELSVTFHASDIYASISKPPKARDYVLAIIRPVNDRWVVPIDRSGIMPGKGWAMAVVSGPDDPVIIQTLKSIQAARIKGKAAIDDEKKKAD